MTAPTIDTPQAYWEKGKAYRIRAEIARKQADKYPDHHYNHRRSIELARKYEQAASLCEQIARKKEDA